MTDKQCSIDHCQQSLDPNPLSGPAHARQHKREFEEVVGRPPEDYREVRALFNDGEPPDDADLDGVQVTQLDDYTEAADHRPLQETEIHD